jgi:predicted phage terminase large subunit-like protein
MRSKQSILLSARIRAKEKYKLLFQAAAKHNRTWATMRALVRKDIFFLLVYIMGRVDADRDWIFDRCREVQKEPNDCLDIWAREHYKSTIITLTLSIQDILKDPEVTIGIFSFNRPVAKGFLIQIKSELENNDILKWLFPDILWKEPKREAPRWSLDSGIVVKRKSNPKEGTVEAWGLVDGQPTSKHFRIRMYDDVITRESVTTPEMIMKVTEAWELSINLGMDGGIERYVGTFYHYADTYRVMIDRKAVKLRKYPATDDGTINGNTVLMSIEWLKKKRRAMGPFVFSCQMLCDPKQENKVGFDQDWLRYWHSAHYNNMNVYIFVDPAGKKKKSNDYTVFTVIGIGSDKNTYVIRWVRNRLNLTERGNVLFALHREHRPLGVYYEEYGMQSDVDYMHERQERENYRFNIQTTGGKMNKEDRIQKLIPKFEEGRLYIPETCMMVDYQGITRNLTQDFINDEYVPFPFGDHDDMLDCLARIEDPNVNMAWPEEQEYGDALLPYQEDDYDPLTDGILGGS